MKSKILKIALVGLTNAGKSTLVNCIVGETVSITNKKINTTQEVIIGIKNIQNIQMIFYDTPGSNFLKTFNKTSKNLKSNLWKGIENCELILYLVDSSYIKLNFLFDQLNKLFEVNKKIIIVFNKIDLISSKKILPLISRIDNKYEIEAFFLVSALKNIGVKKLLKNLESYSYYSKWIYSQNEITDKDDIYIINELLRETLLKYLHKEIPYNLNIETSNYKELKNNQIKIKQKIYTNEKRYKKIILGKKGEMIKQIREDCQKKINKLFNKKIHLYLELINL